MTLVARQKEKIEIFLYQNLQAASRRKIRKILDSGNVFVNDKRVWIAKFKVQKGDRVNVTNFGEALQPLRAESVIFENNDFLILSKPAGLVVESDIGVFPVLEKLKKFGYTELSLVHRLDKETSGLMVIAKHSNAQKEIVKNWSNVQKTYLAICFGKIANQIGTIDFPIAQRSCRSPFTNRIVTNRYNRTAITNYEVLAYWPKENISLVKCLPLTGRTHQIRIHLAWLGNPIVGDKLYATQFRNHSWHKKTDRQMLHAFKIEFTCYDRSYKFCDPPPSDFQCILNEAETTR
jgi:23S rRNA pseudouridine1911/1915/1917 synthase